MSSDKVWYDASTYTSPLPLLALPTFINYCRNNSGLTLFRDTRTGRVSNNPLAFWEKKVDEIGRPYYLDHVVKSASYCNPLKQAAYDNAKKAGKPVDDHFQEQTVDGRKFWSFPETRGAITPWPEENRGPKL